MTILEPNQPWPEYYFRRRNSDGIGFTEGVEDKNLNLLVDECCSDFKYDHQRRPTIIFIGPRAKEKMKQEIIPHLMIQSPNILSHGRPKYMGLDLVFAIDDGLWIA